MADDPKPLSQPGRMRFNFATQRVDFVPPTAPDFTCSLPSFGKALGRFLNDAGDTAGPTLATKPD